MDITIMPRLLQGQITAPPSKSMAHRLLICGACADKNTQLICPETGHDIAATVQCLNALGADIQPTDDGYYIRPIRKPVQNAVLHCKESGSTLRFLLPVVGALGVDATFVMEGRLPCRPLSPLWEEMERMGCRLSRPSENTLRCQGKLEKGHYCISGNVSSQFVSGLLLALPLIGDPSHLQIRGTLESAPYVDMTVAAVQMFKLGAPDVITVEGDWSNAAFWLAANCLGSEIDIQGLDSQSMQGDRCIAALLPQLRERATISMANIPDLMPIMAVVAAARQGAVFTDIGRLRLKESDRIASTTAMITALGGQTEVTANALTIHGTGLQGGNVDSFGDHRIAMAAAIAATVCKEPVTIAGAQCVHKSYPKFWDDYARLGGNYGQQLR